LAACRPSPSRPIGRHGATAAGAAGGATPRGHAAALALDLVGAREIAPRLAIRDGFLATPIESWKRR